MWVGACVLRKTQSMLQRQSTPTVIQIMTQPHLLCFVGRLRKVHICAGARNDAKCATKLVYSMVTQSYLAVRFVGRLQKVHICAGAQNDLERVTKMAYAQVGIYGMNEKVGLLSFPPEDNRFDKPYSNETARLIDEEARKVLNEAYVRTKAIITERKDLVLKLAEELLEKEVSFSNHFTISTTFRSRQFCAMFMAGPFSQPKQS